jgi:hypothetical protein
VSNLARGDDPRYLAALAACEAAQARLESAHMLVEDDPDRLNMLAEAYERRAAAWARLAEVLPMGMPLPFCTALYVASVSDAERARDYRGWAAERGSGEAR